MRGGLPGSRARCRDALHNHPTRVNMAASDPYFRFPLSALALPWTPVEILDSIISYGVVSAGLGAEKNDENTFRGIAAENPLEGEPEETETDEYDWWLRVCAGARLTKVRITTWRSTWDSYRETEFKTGALHLKSALVTIKAQWVWSALNTALEEEGRDARAGDSGWLTWREFRVLCAVLSVIGIKPFAWISAATLAHRVCGYTSAASMKGRKPTRACPLLTRRMLETTLGRLEINRFFLRCRLSRNPLGKGGRTAYSVRHADRKALIDDIRRAKPVYTNRQDDHALWTNASASA